jgi:hypothetical protein
MQHQRVRVAMCANASPTLLDVCQLLRDCTCSRQIQRSPNCVRLPDFAGSRDQLKLQELSNKHIYRHLEQKLPDVKAVQNDDKEFEQILLNAQRLATKLGHLQIVKFRQSLRPSQLDDLRQGSVRDDLL